MTNLSDVHVLIGFGVDAVGGPYFVLDDPIKGELNNTEYLLAVATIFVDVTDHVAAITIRRGRERELDEYATGTATVVFNDNDRTFDPAYSGSPYAGEIIPMKRLGITWQSHNLFQGWVDDWAVSYEPGDRLSRVTAKCVDSFGILASQELDTIAPSFAGDTSGQRVTRVLNRGEVNFPASRSIDTGNSTLGDTTYGANALAYLHAVTRAEAGYLFVAADGTLTFRNRTSILNQMPGVVFSDDRTAGIPYRTIDQRSTSDLLYTRVTGESETTGNPQVATNTAAADEFLIRTLALGSLFVLDDLQTQNLVNYHLQRFSSVEVRFASAEFNLVALSAAELETFVSLDLTDVVTVERSPLSVGATIERASIVDGVDHHITMGKWTATLAFANADTRLFIVLNDATLGRLGFNRLAF